MNRALRQKARQVGGFHAEDAIAALIARGATPRGWRLDAAPAAPAAAGIEELERRLLAA